MEAATTCGFARKAPRELLDSWTLHHAIQGRGWQRHVQDCGCKAPVAPESSWPWLAVAQIDQLATRLNDAPGLNTGLEAVALVRKGCLGGTFLSVSEDHAWIYE